MHYIEKKTRNKVRALTDLGNSIISNCEDINEEEKRNFALELQQVKDQYWIECNCLRQNAILVIYKSKNKVFIRCKERASHDINCSFVTKNLELDLPSRWNFSPLKKLRKFDLYSYKYELEYQSSSSIRAYGNGRINNIKKLGQALYGVSATSL